MTLIILAAGQGTRLRPITDNQPKCMTPIFSKSILEHQIDVFKELNLNEKDTVIVSGYKSEKILPAYGTIIKNPRFAETNMVYSFFCAEDYFLDDIIISYGDIVYSKSVLLSLLSSNYPVSVVVDLDWKRLWDLRMEDPLLDAETLKIENEKIIEIGNKTNDLSDIQAQYIGLIKIKKSFIPNIISLYSELSKRLEKTEIDNMYMTSFIQFIIDTFNCVYPVYIKGDWFEVDTLEDIKVFERLNYISTFSL